jgi:uncharacterized protein (DUF2267 family)
MEYDEFIKRIQAETKSNSSAEAEASVEAVLGTLGQRLERTVRSKTAAQLPNELKEVMIPKGEGTDRYDLPEFYNRVGARANLPSAAAAELARQVLSVFRQAVTAGSFEEVRQSLPDEYHALFD